jgi:hypothetical protein
LNLATWRLPSVGIDYRTEIEDEEPSLQTSDVASFDAT